MSNIVKLKRGLDIHLVGEAKPRLTKAAMAESYAVMPPDFEGVTPKLLVKVGDQVKAGSPLFFRKGSEQMLFTSPVSGVVAAINRGEKRKVLSIVVTPDAKQTYEKFEIQPLDSYAREDVAAVLLQAGLWPMIMQRPYGIIANPADTPKAVFISGFDSAPLAPDMNFVLKDELENLNKGVEVLQKFTSGKVHLSLRAGTEGVLNRVKGVEQHLFAGPHPAGNVGVQIHHIDPINKGDIVWTVNVQDLAIIGRLFNRGVVDMTRIIALTGSEVVDAQYVQVIAGAAVSSVVKPSNILPQRDGGKVRVISGNVLTGTRVESTGWLTFYANQITVIPEGDRFEFLGWAMPRFKKFSVSHAYFSWLFPRREYVLDTNLNGGHRALIVTGLFDKYLPMDIYPMYLLKAIIAGDIDKMENLGIYEVVEEDLALCEFVDPSKTEIQSIVRDGINLMIKELN